MNGTMIDNLDTVDVDDLAGVRLLPLSVLELWKGNYRRGAVDKIAKSIQAFGFNGALRVWRETTVMAGNHALIALRNLHDSGADIPHHIIEDPSGDWLVPCIDLSHLDESQAEAFALADNVIQEQGQVDDKSLGLLLQRIGNDQRNLIDSIGYDAEIVKHLIHKSSTETTQVDEDEVPGLEETAITMVGDVWVMGIHKLVCGDCTDAQVVGKCLNDVKPHLMVTDPPYGVNYDPSWRSKAGVNKNKNKLGKVLNDHRSDWREAWALFPGDVAYVWHGSLATREVVDSLESQGFTQRSVIIWVKDRFALGRSDYHWQHEPALYVVRSGKSANYSGGRSQSTVWNIKSRDDSGFGHGTQKPVECMRRPIENNSNPGQCIYDPFCGSGTTIIAAEQLGRSCLAIELNPLYVDMAVRRWQMFTGKEAYRESDGARFNDLIGMQIP